MTDDSFQLLVLLRSDPLQAWKTARPFVEALVQALGDLAPTRFVESADRSVPFDLDVVAKQFDGAEPPESLIFGGPQNLGLYVTGFAGDRDPGGRVELECPLALVAGRGEQLVRAIAAACNAIAPQYGWGHSRRDVSLAKEPNNTNAWAPKRVHQAYWATILGAAIVKQLGAEHVAATPAHQVEKLRDGSVLIVTSPDPADVLSPAAREAQARALAHLTRGDEQAIRAKLLERSATLGVSSAPAAAPAATVTEWTDVMPSDVTDEAAAIRSYINDAEIYVSGFHDEIPKLAAATSESLAAIDEHFLERDYWAHDTQLLEEKMLPTLGAHLARLLVDELGGRWVPRRVREETQVVVGDRAWLPFLRVKHFLASRTAARGHSLRRYFDAVQAYASAPSRT